MTATQKQLDYISSLLSGIIDGYRARRDNPTVHGEYAALENAANLLMAEAIVIPSDLSKEAASAMIDALKVRKFDVQHIKNHFYRYGKVYLGRVETMYGFEHVVETGRRVYGDAWAEVARVYLTIQMGGIETEIESLRNWLFPVNVDAVSEVETEPIYEITDDMFGDCEPCTLRELSDLVRDWNDGCWTYTVKDQWDGTARLYLERAEGCEERPSVYTDWKQIADDEWFTVVAKLRIEEAEES
jgi:hypothetical protein